MALTDKINAIADAIREKTGKEDKMTLAQMPEEITGITTIPDMNNPADSMDVAYGKEFVGEDGAVDIGELKITSGMVSEGRVPSYREENKGISMQMRFIDRMIVQAGSVVELIAEASEFGSATANQVTKGATFTSAAGLLVEGTMEPGSGSVTLPDLDNPASAVDVVEGKEFIGEDGTVVEGTLVEVNDYLAGQAWNNFSWGEPYTQYDGDAEIYNFCQDVTLNNDALFREGVTIPVTAAGHRLGNAKPEDVAKGVTFTSQNGLRITGTHVCSGGVELPTLTNPGTAFDLADEKELIGADGQVITGTVPAYSDGFYAEEYSYVYDEGDILAPVVVLENSVLIRQGAEISIDIPRGDYGDAKPEDVAQGKTFTSAAGFKVEGTGTMGGSGFVIKTGTTLSGTIETGLSEIEEFFIYKESQTAAGLIRLHYSKTNGTSYMHAQTWSTNAYGSKVIVQSTAASTQPMVDGGNITLPGTSTSNGGLSSGVTYKWVAIGAE